MGIKTSDSDFVKQVITEGRKLIKIPQEKLAVAWSKIFAQSLLKVAKKLSVEIELNPHSDCFWIRIKAAKCYTEEASDNMDIIGFDYHYFADEKEFSLFTSVGCRHSWYNQYLFPKLRGCPDFIRKIEKIYAPCYFDRMIRFNRISEFIYAYIKDYDLLADYLNDVCRDGIYSKRATPDECIRKLNSLGVTSGDAIDKLNNSSRDYFNVLEYLNIVTAPPINCNLFLAEDPATIAEFEAQIERHIKGMILIDLIYQFFKATSKADEAKLKNKIDQFN